MSRVASLALAAALLLVPHLARASIFFNPGRWPTGADGTVQVPVCVEADSNVNERGDGVLAGLIHEGNPSLDEVVAHVRSALASSWESVSAVRFTGFESCARLSPAELAGTVRLWLNPGASNEAIVGVAVRGAQHGVSIMPWGNTFNRCIGYVWQHFRVEYRFDCVEQYAVHEFGHAIGFLHEDTQPLSTDACLAQFHDTARIAPADWSADFSTAREYTLVNPSYFDRRSVMTYGDPCADVNGVRFGSPGLSDTDALGAWVVYPPPLVPGGILPSGDGLRPGEQVFSPDGRFRLILQTDGNLVLYGPDGARWASGTWGRAVDYAVMQVDGNLVLYGAGLAVWATGTNGRRGAYLAMQSDGNLVLYTGATAVWATGTNW
jgi:hypothetical protein